MTSWTEVLDLQLAMYDWMSGEMGQKFVGSYWVTAYDADAIVSDSKPDSRERAFLFGAKWARITGIDIFNAEPIYVDPDMMTVVERAVDTFEPEVFTENDLITQNGLLVLPRSLELRDIFEKRVTWRMASWALHIDAKDTPGIRLTLYHDRKDPDDFDFVDDPEAQKRYIRSAAKAPLVPTHIVTWSFGEEHPGTGDFDVRDDGSVIDGATAARHVHRQFQGIMRLLQQHLAEVAKVRPPRAAWRRAVARKLPTEHVTVVRLRRPANEREPGEPSTVHWSHRWLVGGHWRNQWYPTLGLHRRIWISPYVKGPEELELVVNKARVFALVR